MAVHKQTYGELTTLKCGHPLKKGPVDRSGVWHRISGDDLWKASLGPFLSLVIWKSIQFESIRDNILTIFWYIFWYVLICFVVFFDGGCTKEFLPLQSPRNSDAWCWRMNGWRPSCARRASASWNRLGRFRWKAQVLGDWSLIHGSFEKGKLWLSIKFGNIQ